MHNITDYLKLVKTGKIKALGQRCEGGTGYYCVIEKDGKLLPAIVKIEGEIATVLPTKPTQNLLPQNEPQLLKK